MPSRDELLQVPFDVALTPDELHTTDAALQALAGDVARQDPDADLDDEERFHNARCSVYPLAYFQRLFEAKQSEKAVALLSKRCRVDLRSSTSITLNDEPSLVWDSDVHFVDLLIVVGSGLGLGAILPNQNTDHTYELTIDLKQSFRGFSAKYAKLGFDPTGSMLWIGRTPSSEDIWLSWAPEASLEIACEDIPAGTCEGTTQLGTLRYRIAVMFLAYALHRIGYADIVVTDRYPEVESYQTFKDASNILERSGMIHLNLRQLKALDRAISTRYHHWIARAPAAYKADGFFGSRVPVAVTSLYGQNQDLGVQGADNEEEAMNWVRWRDFGRVRYVTIAIATHLSVWEVDEWVARPVDEVASERLYDSADRQRQEITEDELREMDLTDESGHEIPVYTRGGFQVQRRLGTFTDQKAHGVLMNLMGMHEMFEGDDDYDEEEDEEVGAGGISYDVYPQAGLRSVGHFQAKGLMIQFGPLVESLNRRLLKAVDNEMDEELLDAEEESPHAPVTGISCQAYNSVMHSTRGRRQQHHDAQLGVITGALSGAWADTEADKRTAAQLDHICRHRLPHKTFREKISKRSIGKALRLENVFCIDIAALRPEFRTGSAILDFVLLPLGVMWSHNSLMDVLKRNVVLFKPEAYPAVYNCTTYPITCLLDRIYDEGKVALDAKEYPWALLVEVCSVAERALNCLHTGNMAVIATSVMNPLWIGRGLVHDGLPCLDPRIVDGKTRPKMLISSARWPYDANKHQPKTSAKGSIIFRYSDAHFNLAHVGFIRLAPVRESMNTGAS